MNPIKVFNIYQHVQQDSGQGVAPLFPFIDARQTKESQILADDSC